MAKDPTYEDILFRTTCLVVKLVEQFPAFLLAICCLTACNNPLVRSINDDAELAGLLQGIELLGDDAQELDLPNDDILGLDPGMQAFVDRYLPKELSRPVRVQMLLSSVFSPGTMGMKYDFEKTFTAGETFSKATGNCLSFSNMVVALARSAGLKTYFHEVEIPPTWSEMEENRFYFNRHVNVFVETHRDGMGTVIDINMPKGMRYLRAKRLSDEEAFSQYFNNLAVEYMYAGDKKDAFRYFKKALLLAPSDPALWANLGTLYRRAEFHEKALLAYEYALQLNPDEYVAMSNLAGLYAIMGDKAKSLDYGQRTKKIRDKNPYYRYYLAENAYQDKDYQLAREHLLVALKAVDDDVRFYRLLGNAERELNNPEEADKYLAIAEALSASVGLDYSYQLNTKN